MIIDLNLKNNKKFSQILRFLILTICILFFKCTYSVDSGDDTDILQVINYQINNINLIVDDSEFQELLLDPYSDQKIECQFSFNNTKTIKGKLKIHGSTSVIYPKKSFRLYFNETDVDANKLDLFKNFSTNEINSSRTKHSSFVLNANSIDFSYLRNFLSMYITNKLDGLSPKVDFIEVSINNNFYGLYTIIERIDDFTIKQILNHNSFSLYKSYTHTGDLKPHYDMIDDDDDEIIGFELKYGSNNYLKDLIDTIYNGIGYSELSKISSTSTLYAYFLSVLYTDDKDALTKNYYLYSDNIDNKFDIIRWDADASIDNAWNGEKEPPQKYSNHINKNGIYNLLNNDNLWKHHLSKYYIERKRNISNFVISELIDSISEMLILSVEKDLLLWNIPNTNYFINELQWYFWGEYSNATKDDWLIEIDSIKEFFNKRYLYFDELMNELN